MRYRIILEMDGRSPVYRVQQWESFLFGLFSAWVTECSYWGVYLDFDTEREAQEYIDNKIKCSEYNKF